MNKVVMIVDEDTAAADLLELYLVDDGYRIYKFHNGESFLRQLETITPDLLLLDVGVRDIDGFDLCRKLRRQYVFPIIMLSVRGSDKDLVRGLTLGADDYVTKPYSMIELLARIKAQLRRYTRYNHMSNMERDEVEEYSIRGLVINHKLHKCWMKDRELALTPIEFNILWYLCRRKGSVVSSEELFEAVWGQKFMDNHNTVMTHIGRLREKMQEPARKPQFIKTVWGVGYQIE